MRRLLQVALLGAVVWLLLSRCNSPMVGKAAPELRGLSWIAAEGVALPSDADAGWRVLAFFSPG
ncbi:MAG: hypothetical protein H8E31_01120 [Planctomycetes bacterium]|nr:hypothetical protein [Planctomycetota bacterium]